MRRLSWCLGLLLFVGPAVGAEPKSKLVQEIWDAAYLESHKAGFFHTTVHEIERDGQKILRTSVELDLTILRYKELIRLRMINGTEETPEGKVTGVFMTQFLDQGKQLVLTGTVDGKKLHVKVDGGRIDKMVPWNDEVIGLYRQERLYKERKAKAGDQISYLSFEPTINSVVTIRATVKDEEEVDIHRVKKEGERNKVITVKERLLRIEAVPDKVEFQGKPVPLPSMTSWLDKDLLPLRAQLDLPGIGKVVLYRTTAEVAKAPATVAKIPDLGRSTLISLNKAVPRPAETKNVVYRITVKDDDDPTTTFAQDSRQQIKNAKGNSFELHVKAIREPQPNDKPGEPPEEFLKSCYYLNCDDAKVKEHARRAVGTEKDPWEKAKLIEKWVYHNLQKNNSVAFTSADQIAKNLEGDCRQHAMLAAALCRAAEVPSRTAVGLVYVNDRERGPVMGFHMWAEVWIKGQWIAIDPTLGQGSVGAAHIKIADHSWYDTQSLTPLLPVARVLGKVSIEVISINAPEPRK